MENHIEILKEEISAWEYKFPSFPGAPRPPIRNRRSHGESLKSGLLGAIETIKEARNAVGIESDNLLVLEISSDMMEPDVDLLQNKLGLSVVEEIQHKDGTAKLIVQFVARMLLPVLSMSVYYMKSTVLMWGGSRIDKEATSLLV